MTKVQNKVTLVSFMNYTKVKNLLKNEQNNGLYRRWKLLQGIRLLLSPQILPGKNIPINKLNQKDVTHYKRPPKINW